LNYLGPLLPFLSKANDDSDITGGSRSFPCRHYNPGNGSE
jgi:hypothetical protein